MTRLVYSRISDTFNFEDKFLWFWLDRTAMDKYGNDLPCTLTGFDTIQEAINNAQSDYYIHESCFPFLEFKIKQ